MVHIDQLLPGTVSSYLIFSTFSAEYRPRFYLMKIFIIIPIKYSYSIFGNFGKIHKNLFTHSNPLFQSALQSLNIEQLHNSINPRRIRRNREAIRIVLSFYFQGLVHVQQQLKTKVTIQHHYQLSTLANVDNNRIHHTQYEIPETKPK